MIGRLLEAVLCASLVSTQPSMAEASGRSPAIEVWVDASALGEGNGSIDRPFKTLSAALTRAGDAAVRIHLAPGLYRGPFRPPPAAQIDGKGTAVLFLDGSGAVLTPRGSLALANVAIQGGSVGIESAATLRLSAVSFSGQRSLAAHLSSETLAAEKTTFSAAVSEAGGIKIDADATATLVGCSFQGPFRRAVELKGPGGFHLSDSVFVGAVIGVHQVGGSAVIERTRFSGGRGPAVFCARGTLELRDVDVYGHEYAVQCGEGASVRALRLSSVRAERAAIALARATGQLEEITIIDSGSFGAVQLTESTVALRRFRFHRAEAYGLLARRSWISVADGAISDVLDSGGSAGEGIHLRGTRGSIESVSILRTAGAGLLAAADSSVQLRDLLVEKCHWGGVLAETLSRVSGSSWTIRNCDAAAIAVPDAAQVELDVLRSEGNAQGASWVECARGGKLRVSRATVDGVAGSVNPCGEVAR